MSPPEVEGSRAREKVPAVSAGFVGKFDGRRRISSKESAGADRLVQGGEVSAGHTNAGLAISGSPAPCVSKPRVVASSSSQSR